MTDGETYLKTRLDLGLSRADVSSMAKRAGHSVSQSTIDRLEHKGPAAIGRGLSPGALGWLEYVYGISDPEGIVDWGRVERGAPVVVHHEKGAFQFHAAEGGEITMFGGRRNDVHFCTFPADRVRLIALTALPPPETARVFESRYKGSDSAYARRILDHMAGTPGAHSVGGMAWTLGMHNAVVSRVAADLAKKGQLKKIQRGVFVLAEEPVQPVTRSEQVTTEIDGHVYEGVQIVHDGPCVFVNGQCSCGILDIGILPPDPCDCGPRAPGSPGQGGDMCTQCGGVTTSDDWPAVEEEEAASVKSALAERVMVPEHRPFQ